MPRNSELSIFTRIKKDLLSLKEGKGLRSRQQMTAPDNQAVKPTEPSESRGSHRVSFQADGAVVETTSPTEQGRIFRISLELQLMKNLGLEKDDPALREVVDSVVKGPETRLPDNYQGIEGQDVLSDPTLKRTIIDPDIQQKLKDKKLIQGPDGLTTGI